MARAKKKLTPSLGKLQAELEQKLAASPELQVMGERLRALGAKARELHAANPLSKYALDGEARKRLDRYMADPYDVRALVRELKSERVRKPRTKPQVEVALRVLNERYPGLIPSAVSIETVQAEIKAHLESEAEKTPGSKIKAPGWDSVKRALALRRR